MTARRRDGRWDTTTMATTMAADDNDNKVDGDGVTGNDDGDGATGDDGDDDDNGDKDRAMGSGATGYDDDDDDYGRQR